jgi:hypothetical protein
VQATQKPNRDVLLAEKVRQVQEEVRYSYGAKRMAHALSKQVQEPVNHKRIARIMREYLVGARVRLRRHPEYWYRQRHTERLSDRQCAPNILNRDFLASCPRKKLVTDVTLNWPHLGRHIRFYLHHNLTNEILNKIIGSLVDDIVPIIVPVTFSLIF